MKKTACALAGVAALAVSAASGELPEKILSGYTGYFLCTSPDHVFRMMDKMGENKFNSIDVKVHKGKQKGPFDLEACRPEIQALYDRAKKNGLILQIYLYPLNATRRPNLPEHKNLKYPVNANGKAIKNAFLVTDIAVWRTIFDNAYQFAKMHRTIPFASLKFDMETLGLIISYDDETWAKFCAQNRGFSAGTPAEKRVAALKEKKAEQKYKKYFMAELEKTVKQFFGELRACSPDLILGYMPHGHAWSAVFDRNLATDKNPAILESWDLYNGMGWRDSVLKRTAKIKKAHPNNLHLPWIRPDMYTPEFLTIGAYYSAVKCDGYSIWVLSMMDEKHPRKIPKDLSVDGMWEGFRKANEAVLADLKEGVAGKKFRVPYKKTRPRAADLDYSKLTIPDLKPVGSGAMKDSVTRYVLREQQTILFYARGGEVLDITLEHLAGDKRPAGLQYALMDQNKNILRNEVTQPGTKDRFKVVAPHTGSYALVVNGGGAGSWYSVATSTAYAAVDGRKGAKERFYFFGPQDLILPAKRSGNSKLRITTLPSESFVYQVNGGEKNIITRTKITELDLPDAETAVLSLIRANVDYTQDFFLSFPDGKTPLVFFGPERTMEIVGK